jgi:hypothetical protein
MNLWHAQIALDDATAEFHAARASGDAERIAAATAALAAAQELWLQARLTDPGDCRD